jgi:hypothetical protein
MSAARRAVGCSASMPPSRQPAFCAVRRLAAYDVPLASAGGAGAAFLVGDGEEVLLGQRTDLLPPRPGITGEPLALAGHHRLVRVRLEPVQRRELAGRQPKSEGDLPVHVGAELSDDLRAR